MLLSFSHLTTLKGRARVKHCLRKLIKLFIEKQKQVKGHLPHQCLKQIVIAFLMRMRPRQKEGFILLEKLSSRIAWLIT